MKHLNFRDLGGIKTVCGRTVREKRLLRMAQPVGLSADEIATLRGHNLQCIVDLRTRRELEAFPVDRIDGVTYTHIDIMGDSTAQAAQPGHWMKIFRENPDGTEGEFLKTYREFATGAHSTAGYSALLRLLAEQNDGAVLFHCAAGKDRTGFAAAIILKILGVSDEEIFADYLRTREYQAHMSEHYIERARNAGFNDAQIDAMEIIFGVKENYLLAALEAAADAHGSFECYVMDGLGIGEEDVVKLKGNLLEG